MSNILIALGVAVAILIIERLVPSVELEKVQGWYRRAFIFNSAQAVIAVTSTYLWDVWFSQIPLFSLHSLPLIYQVIIGYLSITFIYYW